MLLAGLCAVYNTLAWIERREAHLATMALLYASLTAFEGYVCSKHVRTKS